MLYKHIRLVGVIHY